MLSPVEGRVLDGKYQVVRPLRRGARGTAYDALHTTLEKPVRIYVPVVDDPRRFLATSNALANVEALGVIDFGVDADGTCYLVTEARHGEPLDQRLRASGRVSEPEAVAIVASLLDVLGAMHGLGAIHGALEAGWITWDGASVFVSGFAFVGGAPADADPDRTAPELLHAMPAQAQTDVFAVGVLLRDLVGDAPSSELAPILMRATTRAPDQRYPTARAMRSDLERLRTETTSPDPVGAHTFQSGSYSGTGTLLASAAAPSRRGGGFAVLGIVALAGAAAAGYVLLQPEPIDTLREHVDGGAYGAAESYALEQFYAFMDDAEAIRLVHAAMEQRRAVDLDDPTRFDPAQILSRGKWAGHIVYDRGEGRRESVVFVITQVGAGTLEGWLEVESREVRTRFVGYHAGNHLVLWETEVIAGPPEARAQHQLHEKLSFYGEGEGLRSVPTQFGAVLELQFAGAP